MEPRAYFDPPSEREWTDEEKESFYSTKQELSDTEDLATRLSAILEATANALHGGPKENGLWSFHDLPELAAALRKDLETALNILTVNNRGGGHA